MNCSEAQNLIPEYLSGELDEDTRRELEEHISGCPDCQEGMRREQSLGDLIGQSADDPPGDYWDNYNDEVRSRIRGAVAISRRMGCLPGGLVGLIFGGLIVGPIIVWLTFGNGLGKVHPDWLRWLLEAAIIVIVGSGAGIIAGLVVRRTITQGLPKYEREERGLKQIISRNPWYRAAFLAFFIMIELAFPVFVIWVLVPHMHFPAWVRGILAVLIFIGFSSIIPGCYRYLHDYLDGRTDSLIQLPTRQGVKKIPLSFRLMRYALLIIVGALLLEIGISRYLQVPSDCRQEAESAYESGDVDSAVSILRSGIKKYGNRYRVLDCYEYLGRIYVETGKEEQSLVIFHDGVKTYERLLLHPKYSYSKDEQLDFLGDAAQLYIDLGQNREAFQLYSTRLHLSPNDPENMYSVAQGYVVVGYKGEARALYTRIILEFPNSYEARWAQQDIRDMH